MFSITPSEAGCERNFSILKWFYGDFWTCLDISKVESMSMMHTFWMTNIKKEMAYYGREITDDDLRQCTQILTVSESDDMQEIPESSDSIPESISIISLDITSIANLDHNIFNNSNQIIQTDQTNQTNVNRELDNINYDVDNLVSQFLENDK